MTKKAYPQWVCHDCGVKYGKWYDNGSYIGPEAHRATYHVNACDVCGTNPVPVTEPRDYGHLNQEWQEELSPQTLEDLIDHVIDEFNFVKLHKMMTAMNWRWAHFDEGQALRVPSIEHLKATARKYLLKAIVEQKIKGYANLGGGGFMAEADKDGLALSFVFAQAECQFCDFQ